MEQLKIKLIPSSADQLEDHEKYVDNVDVEHNRGHDVLLGTDGVLLAASDQLGVIGQEQHEKDSSDSRVDNIHGLCSDENSADAHDHEGQSCDGQRPTELCEVEFSPEREDRDCSTTKTSNSNRNENAV